MSKYDFSGWATKHNTKCSDGRTIMPDAFKDCDGKTVPLIWGHNHDNVEDVLGHALLENRDEGVYAFCSFNETPKAQYAKAMVEHHDIDALSIYANKLKEIGSSVTHGVIREVSLVLAGANPGALIDSIALAHSDADGNLIIGDEAYIYHEEPEDRSLVFEIFHGEKEEKDSEAKEEKEPEAEEENSEEGETIGDVLKTLSKKQMEAVSAVVGLALEHGEEDNTAEDAEDSEEGDNKMKHNVFDADKDQANVLSHDAMATIIGDAKRCGSMKESFLAHAGEYGIDNIDWLFPDAKNITNQPAFIKRNPDSWVDVVMNGVHHSAFSRIKMMFADLREDDARAKGYATKGKLKKEEVFGLIKRTVEPTTIYKKQKLDRDDVIDITDFDVVSWLKGEMRMMLDEEIARAILFGDGRSASSDDKIKETNIIPIVKDASLYTLTETLATGYTAKDIIKAAIKGQNGYEGGGNTVFFVGNSTVTDMLLVEDGMGRRIYNTVADLALGCSVNKIVKVPDSIIPADVVGLIVDLNDYNVGADKGGAINMFDDFDIDYNQQKYLIETRCSGALTKPFSAVVIKKTQAAG